MTLSRKHILLIFVSAIIVRLAVMVVFRPWEFKSDTAFGYELGQLARSIVTGDGFVRVRSSGQVSYAAFPPVYPFIMAGFFWLFGTYSKAAAIGIFVLQSLCAAVSAVLLAIIGTRLWNARAGLVAGFTWAVYPTSIFYSVVHVWYCELAMVLVLALVLTALSVHRPITFTVVFLYGVISGLVVLTDPTLSIFSVLLLFWWLFIQRGTMSRTISLLVTSGLAAIIVVSPWAVRNWFVLGSPLIIKTNFGEQLLIGNQSLADGYVDRTDRIKAYTVRDEIRYYRKQPELIADGYFMRMGLQWIQNNPMRFGQLTAKRVSHFWLRREDRKSLFRLAYFVPLQLVALAGLWIGVRRDRSLAPLWLFVLIYPLPYYVTHVETGRYSYPTEPFIVVLAAIPLALWFRRARAPFRSRETVADAANVKLRHINS